MKMILFKKGLFAALLFITGTLNLKANMPMAEPCLFCDAPYTAFITELKATNCALEFYNFGQAGQFEIEYDTTGFIVGTGLKVKTPLNSTKLTGLTANTQYDAYVRFLCANNEVSAAFKVSFKTLFTIDVGVSEIFNPESSCVLTENENIHVLVRNFGESPQSLIDLKYSVNGQPIALPPFVDGYYTGVLSTDSTDQFFFDTGFDFSEIGEYQIAAWTELEKDDNISNDTTYYTLVHVPTLNSLPQISDFEENQGGWTFRSQDNNEIKWNFGKPTGQNINAAASGNNAFYTNLTPSNNGQNREAYLESPCFDFSSLTQDPVLAFSINLNSDSYWQGMAFESSNDGGLTWAKVGNFNEPVFWYNNVNNFFQQPVWNGNSLGWQLAAKKLLGLKGKPNVRLRFKASMVYNFSNLDGFAVDNISLFQQIDRDAVAVTIKNQNTSECGTVKDKLQLSLVNLGSKSIVGPNQITAYYQVNNGPVVQQVVPATTIAPNGSYTLTFAQDFNSSNAGTYIIKSWVSLLNDTNNFNDTITTTIVIPEPDFLPIVQDFETAIAPAKWQLQGFFISNSHNNTSFVAGAYISQFSAPQSTITTSNIGPLDGGNILSFDYRFVDYFAGTVATKAQAVSLAVQVSEDCGKTYTTVFKVDSTNHIPSVSLKNIKVPLDAFTGKAVKFRILGTYTGIGDFWLDIDNININGCPANLGPASTLKFVDAGSTGTGSIKVTPSKGTSPYTYLWQTGNTTNSISGLSTGNYCVTITDKNNCQDVECYTIEECPLSLGITGTVIPNSENGKKDGKINLNLPAGAYTYLWSNGAIGKGIQFLDKGDYSVTVTNATGCTQILTFFVSPVGIQEISDLSDFTIRPNPVQIEFQVQFTIKKPTDLKLVMSDMYGNMIKAKEYKNISNVNETFDVSSLPSGMYIISLQSGSQITTQKLLVLSR